MNMSSGGATETEAEAETPSSAAVMVVDPVPDAVTMPPLATVATLPDAVFQLASAEMSLVLLSE